MLDSNELRKANMHLNDQDKVQVNRKLSSTLGLEDSQKPEISATSKIKTKVRSGVRPVTSGLGGYINGWSQAVPQGQVGMQKDSRKARYRRKPGQTLARI